MLNQKDILQTQDMIDKRHLDIRTITMGISLLDCCDPDLKTCCDKIYRKITRCAKDLVKVGEDIEKEFRNSHRQQADFRHAHLHRGRFLRDRFLCGDRENAGRGGDQHAASTSPAAFPLWCRRAARRETGS